MEKDPDCCQDGAKMVPGAGLGTEGTETQLDDFVGAHPDYNEEEEEQKYFRRKRLGVIKNVVAASLAGTLTYGVYLGLLQMQLILHYDETYREVKYSNIQLEDIDHKVLMGINVTPVAALLYTPILIRFFGTKWAMFLAVGIYALFVSSNYWERYYTLVPSAVAIGMVIVPLWASMGNYITRMAQKYYEYVNYKEEQEKVRAPRDACNAYIIIFQTIFYSCFHLSFVCAQMPMVFFLNNYLYQLNHTLFAVKHCGTLSHGTLPGFNKTVLQSLPRSVNLIVVESALMAAAFLAMLVVLLLCGAAYRPMEEIDMRSIGWGNIFQLPFKHMRDYRLQHLLPLFIYSGFEVLFVCTGFSLNYGVCTLGLEKLAYLLMAYGFSASVCSSLALSMLRLRRQIPLLAGAVIHAGLLVLLFCWAPEPRQQAQAPLLYFVAALWGTGSTLNKTGISILLGMLYKNKERQDFIFTIYHWWQALAIFAVYLWSGLPMKVSPRCASAQPWDVPSSLDPKPRCAAGQAVHAAADAGGGGGDVPVDGAEAGTACGIPAAPPAAPTPQALRVPLPGRGQLGRDRLRGRRGPAGWQGEPGRGCPRRRAAQRGRGAAGIGTAWPRPALSAERGHCPPWGCPNPPPSGPQTPSGQACSPPSKAAHSAPRSGPQAPRLTCRPPGRLTDPQTVVQTPR
ncbi:protein unc-93 homolog B1 isoform X1 [Chiroxiphia lanceolata]|uniref:protein unc-93 homolog B1 isoform X1 n=1 Tax=Chiroxiphia lanceolata TaxID=296741 RepID=UPI0013CE3E53|nr:protein unc-93 homolog B1 isoform X1 [Chiroxiphia lanceolata]XP_032546792.1 protein unc-93 homolog B1 isoform X1 [Chiroxiphia lanceolata]XP_032546793.1 protein unc-93 homolog B1 isoform X1 [Chiroxiphia lanceolata]XP_032546794.1 protein unc-93 homolog B1 isoform X1 [Chiroxiphia lanceolata]XP_032546795.1 protein unc-93 homolog B1 isoform X1 [Chiroxiphia lanceolata]